MGDSCEAGWYPDTETGWDRWWDGSAWSEQRRVQGAIGSHDPVPAHHGEPAPGVHIASAPEINPTPAAAVPMTSSLGQDPSINGFQSNVALAQPPSIADLPEPDHWSAQSLESDGFIESHTMALPDAANGDHYQADQASTPLSLGDPTIFEAKPQRIGEVQPSGSLLSSEPSTHSIPPGTPQGPLAEMTLSERIFDRAAAFHDSQTTHAIAIQAIWWTLLLPLAVFCWAASLPPGAQRHAGICASGFLALAASVVSLATLPRAGSEAASVAGSAFGLAPEKAEDDELVATPSGLIPDDTEDQNQMQYPLPPADGSAADSPDGTEEAEPLGPTRSTDATAAESVISSTTTATQGVNPASGDFRPVPEFAIPADTLTSTSTGRSSDSSVTTATTTQRQSPTADASITSTETQKSSIRNPGPTTTATTTTTTKKKSTTARKSTTTRKTTTKKSTTTTTTKPISTQTTLDLGNLVSSVVTTTTTTEASSSIGPLPTATPNPDSTTATTEASELNLGPNVGLNLGPNVGLNLGPNVGLNLGV